ncbi:hypothetical protein Plec18170_006678 [Paecilomyces lecythidis]
MPPTLNAASESWNEGEKEVTPYPSPNALAHVVLRTTPDRYEEMIDFYVRLLKATVTCRGPVITFLRYDYEHHRIAIVSAPEVVRGQEGAVRAGLDHVSFAYKTLTDLARTYVGLRSLENPIKPVWTVNHGPTTSLYYRDPDRNKIELQVDNFDRPEDANEFMGGQYYESNPIGSDFDVDEWAKYILEKAKPDGSEGLTQVEEKALKKRIEVGDRRQLPEVYF